VAGVAEGELLFGDQMWCVRLGGVDRVTGQAIHRGRVGVHAGVTRDAIAADVVAGHAGLAGAREANRFEDFFLVAAAFDVGFAVAVAAFAERVGDFALFHLAACVRVRGECLGLIGVAVAAGGKRGRLLCFRRFSGRCGCRGCRLRGRDLGRFRGRRLRRGRKTENQQQKQSSDYLSSHHYLHRPTNGFRGRSG